MPQLNNNMIVVFSKLPADRGYIRSCLSELGETIVCFEKESVCFDNLESIQPAVIIVKNYSRDLVWRFVFALNALDVQSALLIVSDSISKKNISFDGHGVSVHCVPNRVLDAGFEDLIGRIINDRVRQNIPNAPTFLGKTESMQRIRQMLPSLSKSKDPILITGEKGVGKTFLAKCVAKMSETKDALVKLNCGELSAKMAIRYAMAKKIVPAGGKQQVTVILESVHLLKKAAQAEILMLLDQPGKWLGQSNSGQNGGVRFIATSDLDLETRVYKGQFRKDLYYRLNVIPISLPALNERPKDIPMLLDYFLINACVKRKKSVLILSQQTKEILVHYNWPGNVDELEHMMGRVAHHGDESRIYINNSLQKAKASSRYHFFSKIDENALPGTFEIQKYLPTLTNISLKRISDQFVSRTEKILMEKALESTSWNRKKAAELLNISYKSMLNKMKLYEIS